MRYSTKERTSPSSAAPPICREPLSHYPNETANKLLDEDMAAHRWYRFVLSFPPHLVRNYLEQFEVQDDQTVLDPFCGTGTTVVECKKQGISSIGVEALPMAYFASKVKTNWAPSAQKLMEHAQSIADEALKRLQRDGVQDIPFSAKQRRPKKPKTLSPEVETLLLKDSLSPLPIHKTLTLMEVLEERRNNRYYKHERLALATTLIKDISNLRFGPEIGVGKLKEDVSVIAPWLERVRSIADDLSHLPRRNGAKADILFSDARQITDKIEPHSIDAVITSPPYPNEKDYTRTTRLETVLLEFVKNKNELRNLKKTLVRSNTRSVYTTDDDDSWIKDNKEIQRIARTIENRRIALGKTSGFERQYHRVTKLYFGGMARHLSALRKVLRPGARLAYVVGDQASYLRVMIRTGQLLASIAESFGYKVLDIELFRTRAATATRKQLREEVVVLRWPGKSSRVK